MIVWVPATNLISHLERMLELDFMTLLFSLDKLVASFMKAITGYLSIWFLQEETISKMYRNFSVE